MGRKKDLLFCLFIHEDRHLPLFRGVEDDNINVMFIVGGVGVSGPLVSFLLKLKTRISIGDISLNDPKVEDLVLDREFEVPATMSFFHLAQSRSKMACLAHLMAADQPPL